MYTYNITHNKHTIHIWCTYKIRTIIYTQYTLFTTDGVATSILVGEAWWVWSNQQQLLPRCHAFHSQQVRCGLAETGWPVRWCLMMGDRLKNIVISSSRNIYIYIYNITVCIYRLSLYIYTYYYTIYIYICDIRIMYIYIYTQCMYSYPLIFFDIWAATAGWFDPRPSLPRRCSVDWAATKSFAVLPGTNEAEKASLFLGIWMGHLWGNIQ
jgi:hypothetical protein